MWIHYSLHLFGINDYFIIHLLNIFINIGLSLLLEHQWTLQKLKSKNMLLKHYWKDYYQKENTRKLRCIDLNAWLFHYTYVRDPRVLVKKKTEQISLHAGENVPELTQYYDYGNLSVFPDFKGTHPAVMKKRMSELGWEHLLRFTGTPPQIFGHKRKLKYRVLNFVENKILGGRMLFGWKNHITVGRFGWNRQAKK